MPDLRNLQNPTSLPLMPIPNSKSVTDQCESSSSPNSDLPKTLEINKNRRSDWEERLRFPILRASEVCKMNETRVLKRCCLRMTTGNKFIGEYEKDSDDKKVELDKCRMCQDLIYPGTDVSCSVRGCQAGYHLECVKQRLGVSAKQKFKCPQHACYLCKGKFRLWRCVRCEVACHLKCAPFPEHVKHLSEQPGQAICWKHPDDWRQEKKLAAPAKTMKEIFDRLPIPSIPKEFNINKTWKDTIETESESPPYVHTRHSYKETKDVPVRKLYAKVSEKDMNYVPTIQNLQYAGQCSSRESAQPFVRKDPKIKYKVVTEVLEEKASGKGKVREVLKPVDPLGDGEDEDVEPEGKVTGFMADGRNTYRRSRAAIKRQINKDEELAKQLNEGYAKELKEKEKAKRVKDEADTVDIIILYLDEGLLDLDVPIKINHEILSEEYQQKLRDVNERIKRAKQERHGKEIEEQLKCERMVDEVDAKLNEEQQKKKRKINPKPPSTASLQNLSTSNSQQLTTDNAQVSSVSTPLVSFENPEPISSIPPSTATASPNVPPTTSDNAHVSRQIEKFKVTTTLLFPNSLMHRSNSELKAIYINDFHGAIEPYGTGNLHPTYDCTKFLSEVKFLEVLVNSLGNYEIITTDFQGQTVEVDFKWFTQRRLIEMLQIERLIPNRRGPSAEFAKEIRKLVELRQKELRWRKKNSLKVKYDPLRLQYKDKNNRKVFFDYELDFPYMTQDEIKDILVLIQDCSFIRFKLLKKMILSDLERRSKGMCPMGKVIEMEVNRTKSGLGSEKYGHSERNPNESIVFVSAGFRQP